MVTKCVVPNCGNACNAKLSVTLFSFPKDSKLIQKWLQVTRAHYLKEIKSHHKVCSDHFEKRCILNHFGATRLAPGAIPTIFEWNRSTNVRAQCTAPILAIRNLNNCLSSNRIILPKTSPHRSPVPKVILPPLDVRVPHLVSTKSGLDLIKSEPLMCDVILPVRENTSNHEPTDSATMFYEERTSNLTLTDQDTEDDECSNGSEHIIGDFGDYTLSTKLPKNYKEKGSHLLEEATDSLIETDCFSSVKDISTFSSSGSSLIQEIAESLQDDTDHFRNVEDIATCSPSGEVIIEECSIIEEEIIPPENVSTPLPLRVFLKDEKCSVASKKATGEPEVRADALVETILEKSLCATSHLTRTTNQSPVLISNSEVVRELKPKLRKLQPKVDKVAGNSEVVRELKPKLRKLQPKVDKVAGNSEVVRELKPKLRKLQPKVDKVAVAPPMVFRVGNTVLPVSSPLVNSSEITFQNHPPNSANLMTKQMAYLIPFRSVITPPIPVKSSNYPDKDKSKMSDIGQSKSSDALTKKQLATPRRANQKKRLSRNLGNPITLKSIASASSSTHSSCLNERRKIEKRLSLKLKEMKVAVKKKDSLVNKLRKDKLHLTQKLTSLRRAFLKLRKDSDLNLSLSKYLKIGR